MCSVQEHAIVEWLPQANLSLVDYALSLGHFKNLETYIVNYFILRIDGGLTQ